MSVAEWAKVYDVYLSYRLVEGDEQAKLLQQLGWEHRKLYIPGESFWGLRLPGGEYFIDNDLLDDKYQFGDIVQADQGRNVRSLLYRTFYRKYGFLYNPGTGDAVAKTAIRESLYLRWSQAPESPKLSGGFLIDGRGHLLVRAGVRDADVLRILTGSGSPVTGIADVTNGVIRIIYPGSEVSELEPDTRDSQSPEAQKDTAPIKEVATPPAPKKPRQQRRSGSGKGDDKRTTRGVVSGSSRGDLVRGGIAPKCPICTCWAFQVREIHRVLLRTDLDTGMMDPCDADGPAGAPTIIYECPLGHKWELPGK